MLSKTLLVFLIINCVSEYTYGQKSKKFFRKDYRYLEGPESFYKFHTLAKTWNEAKRQCALEGASLFYPENQNEAQAVISFWNLNQPHHWIFIGLSDLVVKGVFETIDGFPVSDVYNNWATGEPNDLNGVEDCVVFGKNGFLNDDRCNKKFPFICKKTLLSLEWNQQCNFPNLDYVFNQELGRCYKFHSKPLNWTEAYATCSAEQSYLAVINSQIEADTLVRLTDAANKDKVTGDYHKGLVHLGFHNRLNDGWQAVRGTSLEDTGYARWSQNQPDGGDREQCGSMFFTGLLNDISCKTRAFFICEHEVDTLSSAFDDRFDGQKSQKFFRKDYTYLEALDSFYKLHTSLKTWNDAKRQCAQEGASLFYPKNDNEVHAVLSFWNSTQPSDRVYVGISDLVIKGVFETIDGFPISDVYHNWGPGEPNNANGNEDCVALKKDGIYNDEQCGKKFNFICKKTLRSIEWNEQCNIPDLDYVFNQELGRCYKFHTKPLNWVDAYATCSAEQSYLAVINSQREADILVKLTEAASKDKVTGNHVEGAVHLGFHNRFNDGWQAIRGTTLEDTGYARWGQNQPDGGDREQCGSMFYNGLLNDINCNTRAFFICEHEVDTFFDKRFVDFEVQQHQHEPAFILIFKLPIYIINGPLRLNTGT